MVIVSAEDPHVNGSGRSLRTRARVVLGAIALTVVVGTSASASIGAAPLADPCPFGWQDTPTPTRVPGTTIDLEAVAVAGTYDAWAVGQEHMNGETRSRILHWDGSSWAASSAPTVPGEDRLHDIAARGPSDVWALGTQEVDGAIRPLLLHFDGSSWSIAAESDELADAGHLSSLQIGPDGELWAVGADWSTGQRRPIALRRIGGAWQRVGTPEVLGTGAAFVDVAVVAPDEVWAVGSYTDEYFGSQATIQRWDGRSWTTQQSPGFQRALVAVAAAGPDDVWAVGSRQTGQAATPLAVHWDGTEWSDAPLTGDSNDLYGSLRDVAMAGPDDVWAVGASSPDGGSETRGLTEHWDGDGWTLEPSPSPGGLSDSLRSVAVGSFGERWAVGGTDFVAVAVRRCDGRQASTSLTADPVLRAVPDGPTIGRAEVRATLRSGSSGVQGVELQFDLGARSCVAVTDSEGVARCPGLDALGAVANGGFTVTFEGNSFFGPSDDEAGVT